MYTMPVPTVGLFNAEVVEVTDGDSFKVSLLLIPRNILDLVYYSNIRLIRCNARERSKHEGGPEARVNLQSLLPVTKSIVVKFVRPDKYSGRILSEVWIPEVGNLNDYLIRENWAAYWNGRGTPPLPPWPRPVTSTQ